MAKDVTKAAGQSRLIVATKAAALEAHQKQLATLQRLIRRRLATAAESFYDIGVALREILEKKLYAAAGHASLAAYLTATKLVSVTQADKLIAIVRHIPREEAMAAGQERAFAMLALVAATPASSPSATPGVLKDPPATVINRVMGNLVTAADPCQKGWGVGSLIPCDSCVPVDGSASPTTRQIFRIVLQAATYGVLAGCTQTSMSILGTSGSVETLNPGVEYVTDRENPQVGGGLMPQVAAEQFTIPNDNAWAIGRPRTYFWDSRVWLEGAPQLPGVTSVGLAPVGQLPVFGSGYGVMWHAGGFQLQPNQPVTLRLMRAPWYGGPYGTQPATQELTRVTLRLHPDTLIVPSISRCCDIDSRRDHQLCQFEESML